ncbi:hypothetical protein HPB49_023453 [Dermacentor silvarum]|uniref:Uncharacterized protein n=1 Tax=Dermacentor silvarum TaxID=543639 RepID=A0ACB8CI65_DERSI|nr:hypothetical protein HPB49_023453 [Dermacentor silvarum]
MNRNMSVGRTWKILRHLLDPGSTRTATRTKMAKLRHNYKDDPEAFAEEIVQTHLARPEGKSHPVYRRAPNEELDADFSLLPRPAGCVSKALTPCDSVGSKDLMLRVIDEIFGETLNLVCGHYSKGSNACKVLAPLPKLGPKDRRIANYIELILETSSTIGHKH